MLDEPIASGGMATVHVGRFLGSAGFTRTVAIKRLHEHLARDRDFVAMLLDEARVASRVPHPNVVAVLDVVSAEDELLLVMEYVHGDSLSGLVRSVEQRSSTVPLPIAAAIVIDVLHGLHAAHEARNELGVPLEIVHRDISPQNVLVGADGHARVGDFGIAHAQGRLQTTRDGVIKGKLAYIAPEQFSRGKITRRVDVYATAIVFWQIVAGRPLFRGEHDAAIIEQILFGKIEHVRDLVPEVSPELDAVIARGLARDPEQRFATAKEMALAIEGVTKVASATEVSAWVERYASETLRTRAQIVARLEAALPLSMASANEARSARAEGGGPSPVVSLREQTAETAALLANPPGEPWVPTIELASAALPVAHRAPPATGEAAREAASREAASREAVSRETGSREAADGMAADGTAADGTARPRKRRTRAALATLGLLTVLLLVGVAANARRGHAPPNPSATATAPAVSVAPASESIPPTGPAVVPPSPSASLAPVAAPAPASSASVAAALPSASAAPRPLRPSTRPPVRPTRPLPAGLPDQPR